MRLSRQLIATSALVLVDFAAATPDRAQCLRTRSGELAQLAACGDKGSINYCLSELLPKIAHLCTSEVLETCFVNAGCTPDEARIEASWTLKRCDEKAAAPDLGDLRRRKPAGLGGADDETTDAAKPTGKPAGKTTAPAAQAKTTEAPPKATAAAPKPTEPTQAPATTPDAATAAPSTAEAAAASTFSSSTGTQLVCYTTTTVSTTSCPIQSTGPKSGKETLSCFPTLVSFPTCAAGLLCRSDAGGNPVCMKVDNSFSTAGIIISLVFAVAITAAVAAMCFFCCRERRVQNRLTKAAEAAAIAKAAAIDKKRPSVNVRSVSAQSAASDTQPLIYPGSQPGVVYQSGDADPFADQHRMR